jgi:predicted ATPase
MSLSAISIQGYRSVRQLYLPVEPVSIFVGANGVGKTNLYKALSLLRAAADGTLTRAIAQEGGIDSVLWAGTRKRGQSPRLILQADLEDVGDGTADGMRLRYSVEIGLRYPTEAAFTLEPLIKEERLTARLDGREAVMMERKNATISIRNAEGRREMIEDDILSSETALSAIRDGGRYPELESVRREFLGWRLYHDFRTDEASPLRQPCFAITTPTLSADGHDLAAVLATLALIRQDTVDLDTAIADAFPGARLRAQDEGSRCQFDLRFPDMPRPFGAHELSDGTLKYLCLLGALMGYRLPPLIALNEPEASLHPSLLPPLARLIGRAAQKSRIWIVTHSEPFAAALQEETGKKLRRVVKRDGATEIEGLKLTGEFRDED